MLVGTINVFHNVIISVISCVSVQENVLECATLHQCQEQNPIYLQQELAQSMFVVMDGTVGLFRKTLMRSVDAVHAASISDGLLCVPLLPAGDTSPIQKLSEVCANRPAGLRSHHAHATHIEPENPAPTNRSTQGASEEGGISGTLSMIDWTCDYEMNRWKRYFCVLFDGHIRWSESKNAPAHIGEIRLADATTCVFMEKDTVGYSRVATMLDENELADLKKGSVFAVLHQGQCYLFDTKSRDITEMWCAKARLHIPSQVRDAYIAQEHLHLSTTPRPLKLKVGEWQSKIKELGKEAWPEAFEIFGEPVRHVRVGETFGQVPAVLHDLRDHTALAFESCVVMQVDREQLLKMHLCDVLMPGCMWASMHALLRPQPMERKHSEIDYVLSAVNYMPLFHQLGMPVRRGVLELCKCNVSSAEQPVLAHYSGPFNHNSSVPLYIVLEGKIEIYQGHTLLKEGVRALGKADLQPSLSSLFPRKVMCIHAEEAWGGPQLMQETHNLQLQRMQEEARKEMDKDKASDLRGVIKERIGASAYTLLATEGTTYLTIEQTEWSRMFEQVQNVVFRMSTLFGILQTPPSQRAPQQARLAASLLHGYLFFQQLPFRNTIDLAYTTALVTVEAGIVVAKEGVALNHVLLLLAGTASVHKSEGPNNLRLPIGPGKSVTLEDARVFFGPITATLREGDSFATDSVYTHTKAPGNSLVASSRCHILHIPADVYRQKVANLTMPLPGKVGDGKVAEAFAPVSNGMMVTLRKAARVRTASESRDLAEWLAKIGFLEHCPPGLLDELIRYVTVHTAERGEVLAREGDTHEAFHFVLSGSASVHSHTHSHGMLAAQEHTTGDDLPTHDALSWPTPTDLSMRWGMCQNVIEVGGSFGEVVLATQLARTSTVIARETMQYLSLHVDTLPALAFQDLKDFVVLSQGVPVGLQKAFELRSEKDVVSGMAWLSHMPYFKHYPQPVMVSLSKIAQFLSFDANVMIQTDSMEGGVCLHLVYAGKVEVTPEKSASNLLFAALPNPPTAAKKRVGEARGWATLTRTAAAECLDLLASGAVQDAQGVEDEVGAAVRKSHAILNLSHRHLPPRAKDPHKDVHSDLLHNTIDNSHAAACRVPRQQRVEQLESGKHFVLGQAKAVERSQLVRIDWTQCNQFLQTALEKQHHSTVSFLATLKAFASWNPKDLNALALRSKIIKMPKNTAIGSKAEPLSLIYLVKAGTCEVQCRLRLEGTQGVDRTTDDDLYRTSRPQHLPLPHDDSTTSSNRYMRLLCNTWGTR